MKLKLICAGYVAAYFTSGILARAFSVRGFDYAMHSILGSNLFCLAILLLSWRRDATSPNAARVRRVALACGVCVAVLAFSSVYFATLSLPLVSVMSLLSCLMLLAGRAADEALFLQGTSTKRPSWNETLALLLAVAAIASNTRDLERLPPGAQLLLAIYFIAYFMRLYLQQREKLRLRPGETWNKLDFYRYEQISHCVCALTAVAIASSKQVAFRSVDPWAIASGASWGVAGICSALLFLWPGRSATAAVVMNRALYLLAGTLATACIWMRGAGPSVTTAQIASLAMSLSALAFLNPSLLARSMSPARGNTAAR